MKQELQTKRKQGEEGGGIIQSSEVGKLESISKTTYMEIPSSVFSFSLEPVKSILGLTKQFLVDLGQIVTVTRGIDSLMPKFPLFSLIE